MTNKYITLIIVLFFMAFLVPQVVFGLTFDNPIYTSDFTDLVNQIGQWIFYLAIPIGIGVIIYAGVLMLTAQGNAQKFKAGTQALWYAVIGLAVVLIGRGFFALIGSILDLR